MDLTHLHLLLNHFPIIGTIIGIALMAYALLRKQILLQNTALLLWLVMAILTLPVMKTGEEAEESVEHLVGISERTIHEHEEAAEYSSWLMAGLGVFSLGGLLLRKQTGKASALLIRLAFVLSLVVFASMARTGYLGGLIRHTELQNSGSTGSGSVPEEEHEE